jgi:hypothetical protein
MVNFCLPMDSMVRLSQLSDFIWIEHHKSAIEAAEQIAFGPRGLRKIGRAACELTWQFLFPTVELPHAVYLLEDATFGIWKCILTSCLFSLEWGCKTRILFRLSGPNCSPRMMLPERNASSNRAKSSVSIAVGRMRNAPGRVVLKPIYRESERSLSMQA